jgi:Protein of unknown function (DUF4031)
MSVYVDNARTPVQYPGRTVWKMSHMIADTQAELDEMAEKIGVLAKYKQRPGTRMEHFDVTAEFRQRAINEGAKAVTVRELVTILRDRDVHRYVEGR